ncbi:hypothetical protein JOC83_002156 [Bacillus iocasae]|uniref:Glycogen biosynthesis protein GlgD n=1 Tax=Priestia iocasae TaxID=2291674 RepID=A0ABS2QXV8_9BACI|nr:hypothetical protein [Metabacillus iocasae]
MSKNKQNRPQKTNMEFGKEFTNKPSKHEAGNQPKKK